MPHIPCPAFRVFAALSLAAVALSPARAAPEPWAVAGQQGVIRAVIVPPAQATDLAAYRQQIEQLCQGMETCFVNFYTNTTGAPVGVPLPDAIANQPTAVLRRSAKQGAEGFRWSCRLALPEPNCF